MHKKIIWTGALSVLLLLTGCKTHYQLSNISHDRILVDKRYDSQPDAKAMAFISPYQHQVDSIMSPVVGHLAKSMAAHRPESELSNLLADILMWASDRYDEKPDFGCMNMGGIRASLTKGKVTKGDILDVAPFDNKICFLTLTGEKVMELFQQMVTMGGEAVSHSVRILANSDNKLISATIDGQQVDPQREYRIVTIDYLAEGNDKMEAFKAKTNVNAPSEEHNNLRFVFISYFEEMEKKGIVVDANMEGRIKIEGNETYIYH